MSENLKIGTSIVSTMPPCWSTCTGSPKRRCMSVTLYWTESLPERAAAILSGAAFPICGFMYWTIVWSRLELGLLGSFTYRGAEERAGIWVVEGWAGRVLVRTGLVLRGPGCTAAGIWRGGVLTGFWSLWVERTIRLRSAVFGLSLGRLRQRCFCTRAYRRLRLYRAVMERGGIISLLAML